MPGLVVVGCQFGDEGKGKITDFLAEDANMVVRFQGGNNAGHTVGREGKLYKFHLIPCGILHSGVKCVLGNGVVINPEDIIVELDGLKEQNIDLSNLYISGKAHLILPTHKLADNMLEKLRGINKIGTTGKGIGPTYRDKVDRKGIRLSDGGASMDDLVRAFRGHQREYSREILSEAYKNGSLIKFVQKSWGKLTGYVCDTSEVINDSLDKGEKVIFEGAQGLLLDIDHGTYPFVTSSSPGAGGACIGAGVGPTKINSVLGISKAYMTRVGSGPFPTKLNDDFGNKMRDIGGEYGTTTGRPRDCGWLDLVALKYAVRVNGLSYLAITKLDVLDDFEEICVCIAYEYPDKTVSVKFPQDTYTISMVNPVYKRVEGWCTNTSEVRTWEGLPSKAQEYISYIEKFLGIPVALIGIGADKEQIISLRNVWNIGATF